MSAQRLATRGVAIRRVAGRTPEATDPPEAAGTPDAPGKAGVFILACGAPMRGDDSVALRAVAGMDAARLAGARVRLVGALEPEHLVDLPSGAAVVIIDAVVGVAPGRIIELELDDLLAPGARVMTTSTHQLPLDRVVALARLLRDEPLPGRFVGVGVADVGFGAALSGPLEAALPGLRAAVARAVDSSVP